MSRTPEGVPKVCAKKVRAHFSFPKPIKSLSVRGHSAALTPQDPTRNKVHVPERVVVELQVPQLSCAILGNKKERMVVILGESTEDSCDQK